MRNPVKPTFARSPAGLFVILTASIFVAEVIVMLLLAALPALPPLLTNLLDATFLVVLAFPALRAFAFAPLLRQLQAREAAEAQLREANRALEQRVQERTHGLQQTNHALQTEVVEHTRAEESLRESQQIIEGILNAIPVRVFWKDKNLVYLGCNAIFARDAGFADPKDIIGKDDYQMGWRDRAELYRGDDRQVIESGCAKLLIEEPLTSPEGTTITILTSKIPLHNSKGEISGMLGTFMDITERKQAEEALRSSEERFRIAAETANDVVYEWDLEQSVEWLGKIDDLLGYEPGEFPRTLDGWAASVHPEDLERTMAAIQAHLEGRAPYAIEYRVRRKDGVYRWWSARGAVARTSDGKPTRWVGSITDITERKRVEEQIERLSRFPLENPNPVLRVSAQGVLEYANAAADTLLLAMGAEVGGAVNAEWQARIAETFVKAHPVNIEFQAGDRTFGATLSPVVNHGYVNLYARDITERKQAEMALRQSEERFRLLVEESPDMIGIYQEGKLAFINSTGTRLLGGKTKEELLGRKSEQIIHPDDLAAAKDRLRRRLVGERGLYPVEVRYLSKDGTTLPMEVSAAPITFDGKPAVQFIAHDITKRKLAEEEKARLVAIIEESPDFIGLLDMQGNLQFHNRAAKKMVGLPEHADLAPLKIRDMHPPRAAKLVEEEGIPTILREGIWRGENVLLHRNGNEIPVSQVLVVHRDSSGEPKFISTIMHDITERKHAEQVIQHSAQQIKLMLECAGEGIFGLDLEGRHTFINPMAANLLGYEAEKLIGQESHSLWHHTRKDGTPYPPEECPIYQTLREGKPQTGEEQFWRKDGSFFPVEFSSLPIREEGKAVGAVVTFRDITERKRLEAQLIQSQKMETVGKLAGGIAHEFNSLLTAIIGQSELLSEDLPAGSPLTKNATEIRKAADRAAALTRQLLAYGRGQFLRPEALDLNQVIGDMGGVLRHLMGAGLVDVNIVPAAGLQLVKADAGQIEQVILNLAMNANDAMPNGGKLTLETANVSFDQETVGRHPDLKPGDYVMLAITDTGTGMTDKVKAHVFEPFFTTKDVGQGTGLGLSTCYGIVKQSGGHINVYTELGRGTTFKMYLPQLATQTKPSLPRLDSPDLPRGTETILLVEDDPALREMAATLLKRLGYKVFSAANGVEALSLNHERASGRIDLLFTDVVMPHMSGKELADRVRALYPHTRILFTSAYTEQAIVHQGVLDRGVALLQKPFTPPALALKVREVLDQPGGPKPDPAQKTFGFTNRPGEAKPPGN